MSSENEDEYGEALNRSVLKKRKIQRACDICRRKKIRCDGPQASHNKCSNCIAYSADCTYEEASKKRGRPKGYVEALELKVEKLEKLLRKICPDESILRDLYASMDPDATAHLTKMPTSTDVSSSPSLSSSLSNPESSTTKPNAMTVLDLIRNLGNTLFGPQDDPFRDDDFEHMDLSERIKNLSLRPEDSRFFGKSSGAMFVQTAMDFKNEHVDEPNKKKALRGKRPAFWERKPWEMTFLATPKPTYSFPPDDLITELTNAYFNHVNLFLPLLHRPTFERAIADKLYLRDDGFAGVLLLMCAVASRYLDKVDERVLLDGVDSLHSAGWRWYSQVQVVRHSLLEPPKLYDLQSYCLAVEFLHGCFAPHSCWVLVGIGLRLAQDVGAHRRRVPREKMTVDDELWKRAFWVLITMDRMSSTGLGRPCAILDDDFDLDLPMECDDEYWEHPDPKQRFKQPHGVPSTVSAFVQHIRLNKIMAFALFSIYSIKTKLWEFILQQWEQHIVAELDSALNRWMDSLPEYLRWDPNRSDDRFFKLSAGLMACYYQLQILIHRPFISSKGKRAIVAFPSLAICTNAARSCTHVLELHMKRCSFIYPHMQFSAVTAGIVLLMNMWGSKRSGVAADPKEMRQIYKCMDILKKAEERMYPAGELLDVLNELASVGELILPEEDPALLVNPENTVSSKSSSNSMNSHQATRSLASSSNSSPLPFDSPSASSSSSIRETYSMQAMQGLSPSQTGTSFFNPNIAQSFQSLSSQRELPVSDGDRQLYEQITYLPQSLSSTNNWYQQRPHGSNRNVNPISAMDMEYRQAQASQPSPDVHPDPDIPPLPGFDPGNTVSGSLNPLGTGYLFRENMETTPYQTQRYPGASSDQQRSIVDANTMAVWLNAPTGFEFTEWGTFLSNVTELSTEMHRTQGTDSGGGSGSFHSTY